MNPLDEVLTREQQLLLKQAIEEVRNGGQGFGRVALVYDRGRLRFIEPQRSYDALLKVEDDRDC